MLQLKIICPKCKEAVIFSCRTTEGYRHDATDEVLAKDRVIKYHKCPYSLTALTGLFRG